MPLSINEYIPQTNKSRRPLIAWLLASVNNLLLISMIVAAPLAAANNYSGFAATIYRAFGTLCHQLPDRSFFIEGQKLAVCARCTGLYAGFTLVLILYPLLRPLRSTTLPQVKWLFVAAAPLFIDVAVTFLGIWENTHGSRLLTGILLGGVTVLYVMPGLVELSMRISPTKPSSSPNSSFTLASPENIASAPSDYSAPERRI
jgi:uncharacterized membrane protein